MMKQQDVILKVENVSKQYRLGVVGTGTISHDLNRFLAKVTGKEDPYLKIGESNDRSTKGTSEYVWALKDIDFEVKRGEILGIIGKNGAGKSTLLKILSKVTGPTTGCIKYNGRIASLLEVGTGFHPEMTGRENIFLNGAILGMTKKEISHKLDEIIEFSGCERYVDTPVKRYSSGMKVRLAFAVAAFLEPDILVVDEVLAVGDAEFQKKAIGKMQNISSQAGRTVLFVSHDMVAVRNLCSRCIILEKGVVIFKGEVEVGINEYISQTERNIQNFNFKERKKINNLPFFADFILFNKEGNISGSFKISESIFLRSTLQSKFKAEVTLRISIFDLNEFRILAFDSNNTQEKFFLKKGTNIITCELLDGLEIKPDKYYINISIRNGVDLLDHIVRVASFNIVESDYYDSGKLIEGDIPLVLKKNNWKLN